MNKRTELIANIILILVGISGGTTFYMLGVKDLSLVFFSIALASILYQFLGGIGEDNNFNLGAIKFGGAAAVLIGFMFFLKKIAFVPNPEDYHIVFSEKNWIPISEETGKVIDVCISNGVDSVCFPQQDYQQKRLSHQFKLIEQDQSHYAIMLGDSSEAAGIIDINDFKTSTLFNNVAIDDSEKRLKVFTLYQKDSLRHTTANDPILKKLPFVLETVDCCLFTVKVGNKTIINEEEIVPKTSYIIPISPNESYILFLEQAVNRTDSTHHTLYCKWLAKRIEQRIEKE